MNSITIEQENGQDVLVDIYQKLANDRILFLSGEINDKTAMGLIATLLLKDLEQQGSKITLFINSTGGRIRSAFAIYDVIQMIQSPVETICSGAAYNEAVLLLAAGESGKRYISPHARLYLNPLIMDHMSILNLEGAQKELALASEDYQRMLNILANITGKPVAKISKDCDKQLHFNAQQAIKYGLVDGII